MSSLTVYDRFGNPVKAPGQTEQRYEEFDRKGLFLHADTTGSAPILISVFRAHDRPGGRSNRFFGKFESDSADTLLADFHRAITNRVNELGWRLDTTSSNDQNETFRNLTESTGTALISDETAGLMRWLIDDGQRLDFGVRDIAHGVAVVNLLLGDYGISGTFTVARNGRISELADSSVVLKPGASGRQGLEPLGNTDAALREARAHWQEELVNKRTDDIRQTITESVNELGRKTNYGRSVIEREVSQAVNQAFKQAQLNLQVASKGRLQKLESLAIKRQQRTPAATTTRSSISRPLGRGIVALLLVAVVVVGTAVTIAVAFPTVLAGVPVVSDLVENENPVSFSEDPSYDPATGRLTLSGTVSGSAKFVVVNVSSMSSDHQALVGVRVEDGSFTLDRRVGQLFGLSLNELPDGSYTVSVYYNGHQTPPEDVTIEHPVSVNLSRPVEGQELSGSTLDVQGQTNAETVDISVVGGGYENRTTVGGEQLADGQFKVTFTGLPVDETFTLQLTATRAEMVASTQLTVNTTESTDARGSGGDDRGGASGSENESALAAFGSVGQSGGER